MGNTIENAKSAAAKMTEQTAAKAAKNNASKGAQNSASAGTASSVSKRGRAETNAVSVSLSARASELSRLKDQNTARAAASSNEQQVQEKSASSEKVAASSPQKIGANSVSGGVLSWIKTATGLWNSGDSRFQSKDAASEKGASGLSWNLNSSKTAAGNGAGTLSTPGSEGIEKETTANAEDGSKGPIGWVDIEAGKMGAATPNDKVSGVANQSPLGAEKKVDNAEKPQPGSAPVKQEGLLVSNKTDEKPGDFSGSENDGAENTNPLREFIQEVTGRTAEMTPFGGIAQPGAQENKITSPLEKLNEEKNQSPLNAGSDLLSKVEKEVGDAAQAVGNIAQDAGQPAANAAENAGQAAAEIAGIPPGLAAKIEGIPPGLAAKIEGNPEEAVARTNPRTDRVVTPAEIRKQNEDYDKDDEEKIKSEEIDKEDIARLKDLLEDLEDAEKAAQKAKEKIEDKLGFIPGQERQIFGNSFWGLSKQMNAEPFQTGSQENVGQAFTQPVGTMKGFVRVNNEQIGSSFVIQNSPAFYMGSHADTEARETTNRAGDSFSGRSLSNIQRGLLVYRSLEEMTG